jgi:hypothetical protein
MGIERLGEGADSIPATREMTISEFIIIMHFHYRWATGASWVDA